MNNTMKYRGYLGSVEYSEEDGILYGKVLGIRSVLSYEGESVSELVEDFHGVVDDYLRVCEEDGITPERAYKGSFNVRVDPELHKESAVYAMAHQMTLNSVVESALRQYIATR